DCYQYFCVPEYGTANGRLHFHAVHFMRTLPTGSVDPNFGRRVRNRRQLNSLQNTWPYGYVMPFAVRYTQDAFSRSVWLCPVVAKVWRRVRNRGHINSLQNTWPYGYSMPIAVRYTQDAFSRSGWLWPVEAKGEPPKATSYMAVGFYVAKYVNKKSDMDLAAKG